MKGIPVFVMNVVLKRHPLSIFYIRKQLETTAPALPVAKRKGQRFSDTSDTTSDEEDLFGQAVDLELPDDFIPGDSNDLCSSYEQSMPMEHFTKKFSQLN